MSHCRYYVEGLPGRASLEVRNSNDTRRLRQAFCIRAYLTLACCDPDPRRGALDKTADGALHAEQQAGRDRLRRHPHRLVWHSTGRIYRTDDGGEAWTAIWTSRAPCVVLEFPDAQTGFLGNVRPRLFSWRNRPAAAHVSHDGGVHWAAIKPVAGRQITGVCAIDVLKADGKVLAVRAGGRVGGPAGCSNPSTRAATLAPAT